MLAKVLALTLAGIAVTAPAAAEAAPLLPDLVADPPVGGNAPLVHTDAEGSRLLLRLDGFVHNRGPGPLEIRGSEPSGGRMASVRQRVYDDAGGVADVTRGPAPVVQYETNDDHAHWHLRHAMRYSLWSEDGTVEAGPAQKVGFCLVDHEPVEAGQHATPAYSTQSGRFCESGAPQAPSVGMGVSSGWRDVYSYVLAFQWVDVSDVAPGRYRLRAEADPDGVIAEADELNLPGIDPNVTIVNGFRADPVDAGAVPALGATPITLAATPFDDVHPGSPGPLEFRIVTPPAGGTVNPPAGTWFADPTVTYTPRLGFTGTDTFTFAARDASSPFPRAPRSAAVTLTVNGSESGPAAGPAAVAAPATIGISGAPAWVRVSSTTPLRASGPGAAYGVSWSVDGVEGGSKRSGTISRDGVYRAPARVPPAAAVAVAARGATGASAQVVIAIRGAPRARPAPTVEPPPIPRRGLSRIRLGRNNRSLIAVVSTARTGRVRISARRGARRFGFCSAIVRRRTATTCMMRIPRRVAPRALVCSAPRTSRLRLPDVTVTATLTSGGRVVARRRARPRWPC